MSIQSHWILNIKNWLQQWPDSILWVEPPILHSSRYETWDMTCDEPSKNAYKYWKLKRFFKFHCMQCSVPQCSVLSVQFLSFFTVFGFIVKEFWMTMLSTIKCRHKIQMQRWNIIDNENLSCILSHSAFNIRYSAFALQNSQLNFNFLTFSLKLNIEHRTHLNISIRSYFELFYLCKSIVVHSISSLNTNNEINRNGHNERMSQQEMIPRIKNVWNGVFMDVVQYVATRFYKNKKKISIR